MFFQIEDICAQDSDEAIRRIIRSLPRDLPATYQRALERVVRNRKADVARKMFRWVVAAKRPLSLMEIREAIAVEPCQPFSQQDKLVNDVEQLVPWCGNLLVLDEEGGLVQFAHHSVKDYLLSANVPEISSHQFRIEILDVDHEAGEICCTYLNFSDFERQVIHLPQMPRVLDPKAIVKTSLSASSGPTMTSSLLKLNDLRRARRATEASDIWRQLHLTSLRVSAMGQQNLQTRYYFLAYASEYWLDHTNKFNENDLCWDLFRRLVIAEETTLATKPWSLREWQSFSTRVQKYILKTEHRALLSLADLEQLEYAGADIRTMVRNQYSLLCSDEMLEYLVNATRRAKFWSTWDPILIIAAERCRLDLVKQVLELAGGFESALEPNGATKFNPAPVHMDASLTHSWNSAWEKAQRQDSYEMLELLEAYKAIILSNAKGAYEELEGPMKRTGAYERLYAAVLTGNLVHTRRLLDDDVSPNVVPSTPCSSFNSVLAAAASWGSLEVVELLLYAGAEVNSRRVGLRETALSAAARHGKTPIVIALLAAGADKNARTEHLSLTPLTVAAGYEDIMVLLLLAGAYFKDLPGCYRLQDCVSLGENESIINEKWRAYVQCYFDQDPKTSYYGPRPGIRYTNREFFYALKHYVKTSCETEMEPIKVKEAVESFLKRRLEGSPEKIREAFVRAGYPASRKDLYALPTDIVGQISPII